MGVDWRRERGGAESSVEGVSPGAARSCRPRARVAAPAAPAAPGSAWRWKGLGWVSGSLWGQSEATLLRPQRAPGRSLSCVSSGLGPSALLGPSGAIGAVVTSGHAAARAARGRAARRGRCTGRRPAAPAPRSTRPTPGAPPWCAALPWRASARASQPGGPPAIGGCADR